MKKNSIELKGGVARNPLVRLANPINIAIGQDEHIAIVGSNGAGKSILIDTLLGKYPLKEGRLMYDFSSSDSQTVYDNVKYVAFRDTYGSADANYYYQQRWNATDQEDAPTVREQLGRVDDEALSNHLFKLFRLDLLLDKKVIQLSSGELRKFQLVKALLTLPQVLIIDNPFIGLDVDARFSLRLLLKQLSELEYLQVVLVLSIPTDIPSFITHVVSVNEGTVAPKQTLEEYRETMGATASLQDEIVHSNDFWEVLYKQQPITSDSMSASEIVRLNNVSIRYGNRVILNKLDWVVRQGEKWVLCGGNGVGKSTLLSLICADNPQSYACDISLFGRKRGTGESIWDIKKKMGYVSPEMHRAYLKNIPAIEIVASGLHDSIGLYKRPQASDLEACEAWMATFGLTALKERPFLQLSSGEQRLVLLARAFVKDPELLILDEPYHGLDAQNRDKVKQIIECFCARPGKTLIMVTHDKEELPQGMTNHLWLERNDNLPTENLK